VDAHASAGDAIATGVLAHPGADNCHYDTTPMRALTAIHPYVKLRSKRLYSCTGGEQLRIEVDVPWRPQSWPSSASLWGTMLGSSTAVSARRLCCRIKRATSRTCLGISSEPSRIRSAPQTTQSNCPAPSAQPGPDESGSRAKKWAG
jgi:hypothetical protein